MEKKTGQKPGKALRLSRETLRQLATPELQLAAGGLYTDRCSLGPFRCLPPIVGEF